MPHTLSTGLAVLLFTADSGLSISLLGIKDSVHVTAFHPPGLPSPSIPPSKTPKSSSREELAAASFQPQEITVKRLEMHDMLWRTIPRRKTRTQATRMTVQTPDQVEQGRCARLRG
uniref:Uncharacterized protein n=1 Tax=Micrurus surinamensis TaxID=129470 RepID=A0A2D4Q0F1_MICSU